MSVGRHYLDNAATTPVDPAVSAQMCACLGDDDVHINSAQAGSSLTIPSWSAGVSASPCPSASSWMLAP